MKESNQVSRLMIASAVIALAVPAIASAADRESRRQFEELSQGGQGQSLHNKLDTNRDVGDKKIEAQSRAADSRGVSITETQEVVAGNAVRAADAVVIIDVRRVEDFAASVSYSDLDLSTEVGLVTLYERLQTATDSICGSRSLGEAGTFEQLTFNKQCYRDALTKAVAKLNNTMLDEIHAESI